MDETLREKLGAGEQLLWSGKPESFETLDKTNKKRILLKIIIAVAVCALLLVEYVILAGKNNADIKPAAVIVVLACGVYFCLDSFLQANQLKKVRYAITDKRLLCVSGDEVKSVSYENVPAACFKKDEDGHVTLLCGEEGMKAKPSKWRSIALHPLNMANSNVCESFAFYALPDADRVKKILKEYLTLL